MLETDLLRHWNSLRASAGAVQGVHSVDVAGEAPDIVQIEFGSGLPESNLNLPLGEAYNGIIKASKYPLSISSTRDCFAFDLVVRETILNFTARYLTPG